MGHHAVQAMGKAEASIKRVTSWAAQNQQAATCIYCPVAFGGKSSRRGRAALNQVPDPPAGDQGRPAPRLPAACVQRPAIDSLEQHQAPLTPSPVAGALLQATMPLARPAKAQPAIVSWSGQWRPPLPACGRPTASWQSLAHYLAAGGRGRRCQCSR